MSVVKMICPLKLIRLLVKILLTTKGVDILKDIFTLSIEMSS